MRRVLLDLLPQELNRVEIRRVGGQLEYRQTVGLVFEELLHSFTGVILGSILDQDQMLRSLLHHLQQELSIAVRIEAARVASVEQPTCEKVNQAKDLVGLALAARRDCGLTADPRPRVAQRAPLGKAGLVAKQNRNCSRD